MTTYSGQHVKTLISEKLKPSTKINVADAFYVTHTIDYFTGKGYKKFKKWLHRTGIFNFSYSFDCDNYAEAYRVYTHLVHTTYLKRNKLNDAKKQSIGVGIIWYTKDDGIGHAINIILTKNDDYNDVILFFEPQTGDVIELTENEKQTINYILI